ncbi:MAG: hypothetical protein ACN6O3_13495 [Comamonas sp.]
MRGNLDFGSWSGLLTTLLSLVLVSLVAVGIRLVFMQTLQRRRERENRQINERLKTLIAAYKTLGGAFTGNLDVDPTHRRDLRRRASEAAPADGERPVPTEAGLERRRLIRDAVEAALSDVLLLGTQEQVRLATQVAQDMVAGRTVQVGELVTSLRTFIRQALDLEPIPADLAIPSQGPLRSAPGAGARRGGSSGGGGGGGGGMGAGLGGGIGLGMPPAAGEPAGRDSP